MASNIKIMTSQGDMNATPASLLSDNHLKILSCKCNDTVHPLPNYACSHWKISHHNDNICEHAPVTSQATESKCTKYSYELLNSALIKGSVYPFPARFVNYETMSYTNRTSRGHSICKVGYPSSGAMTESVTYNKNASPIQTRGVSSIVNQALPDLKDYGCLDSWFNVDVDDKLSARVLADGMQTDIKSRDCEVSLLPNEMTHHSSLGACGNGITEQSTYAPAALVNSHTPSFDTSYGASTISEVSNIPPQSPRHKTHNTVENYVTKVDTDMVVINDVTLLDKVITKRDQRITPVKTNQNTNDGYLHTPFGEPEVTSVSSASLSSDHSKENGELVISNEQTLHRI